MFNVTLTRAMIYGTLLQIIRTERELSQRDVLTNVIKHTQISRYESGKAVLTLNVLADICDALDTNMATLVEIGEHIWVTIEHYQQLGYADMNTRPRLRWLEKVIRNNYRDIVLKLIHSRRWE